MDPQIIAFYLPQYHPTPHNNEWWGEGFTEWTNVAKAKPLYPGHYQPKIPADLGFYDLRVPEVRLKQAELAKEAGVNGFCYYHYWFGEGKQELEYPFNQVVQTGEPDFPFCLCWANESWARKMWNKDGAIIDKKILIEQNYFGEEDDIKHFYSLLPAFKDKRYICVDNKLLFMIYKPLEFPEVKRFITLWNKLAIENGLQGFYFVGYTRNIDGERKRILDLGFDAIVSCRMNNNMIRTIGWFIRKATSIIFHTPRRTSYKKIYPRLIGEEEKNYNIFPTMMPNWDHTPRSGIKGDLYEKSTPELFQKHAEQVLSLVSKKPKKYQIIFLKSWNEWGEGNYMEPDLKFGKGYIYALRNALKKYKI